MALLIVLSIVVLKFLLQAEADSTTQCRCFSRGIDNGMCKAINISCPPGTIIYKPVITASSEDCPPSGKCLKNRDSCVGKPVELQVDIFECYWKQSCLIKFPTTPIYTRNCLREAQSILVHYWMCMNATSVHFKEPICKSKYIGTNAASGVILSHQHIPWNYDKRMFTNKKSECQTRIIVPTAGDSRVVVETDLFDIDTQNDQLTINKLNVVSEDFRKKFRPNTEVNVKFTSNFDKSKGGKGFVICFRRLNGNEGQRDNKPACEGIMEFGKDPKLTLDKVCQQEQPVMASCEDSTLALMISTTAITKTSKPKPDSNKECMKCFTKRKLSRKCMRRCCKGKETHPKCRQQSSPPPTTTTTTVDKSVSTTNTPGQCNVKKNRKFCSNCVRGKVNCGKKKRCYTCCPGKTISTKCKKRNTNRKNNRNRRRKGKKKKKDKKGS